MGVFEPCVADKKIIKREETPLKKKRENSTKEKKK